MSWGKLGILMRGSLAFSLLVLFAALAPAPAAFAAEGVLLADKEGDVVVTNGQGGAPLPPNAQTASADLRELVVVEDDIDLTFTLKLASLSQQGGSLNNYVMSFTWLDANFEAGLLRSRVDPTSVPLTRATFSLCEDECVRVTDLEHVLDEEAGTFSFLVPKRYITSLEGHAPVFGSELTGIVVRSLVSFDGFPGFPATGARAEDVMPDTGAGVITYQKGGSANGHIILEAPDPVRVSNGGATTFVFNGHVQNRLDVEDSVTFALEGVPATWTATAPGFQTIPAQDEKPVFVLATIPFGHEHGGFSTFNLTATSAKDPTIKASIRFGVLHTPVPMPAGHHSELFLHAAPGDTGLFQTTFPRTDVSMSTVQDHQNDVAEALSSTQGGDASWRIPLAPQLAIGVDADLNRTGLLTAAVNGRVEGQGTMKGELWLVKGDQDVALLGKLADAKIAVSQNAPSPVSMMFTPDAASDYVPYATGNNLELRLTLLLDGGLPPNPQSPPSLVVNDFKLALPLDEYADAPTFEEGEGSTIKIVAQDGLEKVGRPGATVTFGFVVTNLAAAQREYALEIAGTSAKVSESAPADSVRLDAGESRLVTLAIRVPADAQNDERLESILVIRSKSDPSDLTLARTTTMVNKGAAAPDEQAKFEAAKNEGKDTPFVAPVFVIALAAMVALASRR